MSLIKLMKAKIHRAVVTQADLHYEGSIGIDEALLDAAGILPFEAVHVWDVDNASRFETYAIPLGRGSGDGPGGGLWTSCGHEGSGVALGPVSGLLLTQLITGGEPVCDPAPVDPRRFG